MTQCVFEEALKKDMSLQSHTLKQNHQPQSGTYLLAEEGEAHGDPRSYVHAEEDLWHLPLSRQPALRAAVRGGGKRNIASPRKNTACNDILETYSLLRNAG